jgi:hypothetical protein
MIFKLLVLGTKQAFYIENGVWAWFVVDRASSK